MASAKFRIGTAATNTAGTSWSYRAYDVAADIASNSYVKVDLESTTGVRKITVSIPSADEQSMSAGVPTVTTVQASKTATFRAGTGAARTYIIRAVINDGIDQNGDTVSDYTKQLAAHIKTGSNRRLIAVGETDDAHRTYGYTSKLNAAIKTTGGALGSSGVTAGTYTNPTLVISSTGVITSAATGAAVALLTGAINQILQYSTSWAASNNLTLPAGAARQISIATSATACVELTIIGQHSTTDAGGNVIIQGGTPATGSDGGEVYIKDGVGQTAFRVYSVASGDTAVVEMNGQLRLHTGPTATAGVRAIEAFAGTSATKIGFFGATAISQPAVAYNASVATLIVALWQLGLINRIGEA
jgi:hypothetical protein